MPATTLSLVVNSRLIVIVAPGVPVIVAGCPLILTSLMPANVKPWFAVRVTDAVYAVEARNGLWFGDHATLPIVKLPVPVAVVLGIAPIVGATTFTVAVVIGASVVPVGI
jgi:hypothetical protein